MNRFTMRSLILLFIVCTLYILPLVSCSKKDASTKASRKTGALAILDLPLVDRIPATTTAIVVFDLKSSAYQEYRKSQWFDGASYSDQLEQALTSMTASDKGHAFFTWLKQAEFLDGTKPDLHIEHAVGFADIQNKEAGFYAQVPEKVDLDSQIKSLQVSLNSEGVAVEQLNFDGVSGISATLTARDGSSHTIFIAAKNHRLAIGNSAAVVSGLFSARENSGPSTLRKSEAFKLALKELPARDRLIQFSYLNVEDLVSKAHQLPDGDKISQALSGAEVPFSSAIFATRMDGSFTNSIALPFRKNLKDKQRWKPFINPDSQNSILTAAPASALFLLRVHGQLLKSYGPALKAAPLPMISQDPLINSLISSVDDLGLGITNLPGGALFPSLFVLASSTRSDSLKTEIKGKLNPQALGVPASNWQTREINGVPVDFSMSPLGIGAFLVSHDGTLLVGSSDKVVKESLSALAEKKKSILNGVPESARSYITSGTEPLVLLYLDLAGISGLMQGLEGSLAMFTGGASGLDPETIERVRSFGLVLASAGVTEQAVQFRSIFLKNDQSAPGNK